MDVCDVVRSVLRLLYCKVELERTNKGSARKGREKGDFSDHFLLIHGVCFGVKRQAI